MKKAIYNVNIYPNDSRMITDGCALFENGKIIAVGNNELLKQADEKTDGQGLNLLPGFIDAHVHGGYGYDFLEDGQKCVEIFSRETVASGCTSYLASFVCDHQERLLEVMREYANNPQYQGAECLGIHMEGPFLSPERVAVMKPETLRLPSLNEFREMIEASGNHIVQMTIAPEMPGALELIEYGSAHGITMMLGHSQADPETACAAIEKGARGLTHMYNAMGQHEHRQPGLVTAGLMDDRLICELITDGFHIHPDVLKATYRILKNRIAIITDSSLMRGMPDGQYVFSGHDVRKQGIKAQVVQTGTIAGSVIDMHDGISVLRQLTGCSLNEIVRMASMNPAIIARCSDRKGQLKADYDADMVLVDDEFRVKATYVRGERAFEQ